VGIYLNFSQEPTFLAHVVQDVRSFKIDHFNKALYLVTRERLLSDEEATRFDNFIKQIKQVSEMQVEEDIDDDDVPDEYVCPISGSLMEDPVILPVSKKVLDRSSIRRILLSDPMDPFTRTPLTEDMLISGNVTVNFLAYF
jgi:ubiquitin conjugation factor E4 B